MSVQIALLAPATRIASRKLGPTAGSRSPSAPSLRSRPGGLRGEQVREHVRQVRDVRHQPVVGLGVDRRRVRTEATQQRVQALVEHADGALTGGRQVPRRSLEQVRAGVFDPLGLGPRERVTADEALIGGGVREHALGGADIADDAVRAGGRKRRGDGCGKRADGAATNTASAPRTASARSSVSLSTAPSSSARARTSGSGSYPQTSASARARAARPIEPPISPTPRTAIRIRSGRRLRPGGVAIADGSGQPLEHLDGLLPGDAAVGDRLSVAQLLTGTQVLAPGHEEGLDHHAGDRPVPGGDLRADLAATAG